MRPAMLPPALFTSSSSARRDSPVEITSSTISTRLPRMYSASAPSRHRVCTWSVVMERTSETNTLRMYSFGDLRAST